MEDFLIDLQQVREELKAEKKMYQATIKNIYQTSPYLFNCGVQQGDGEQNKYVQNDQNSIVKSKLDKGKQTATKAFNWILKKAGIKRKTLLVPQSIAKVLKSVKPGELSGLNMYVFKGLQAYLNILEYPPTFKQAIPVPKNFSLLQQQNQINNSEQQQNKIEAIVKKIDPLDQQDWNDIHREVLNDLNHQNLRSNSLKLSEQKKQRDDKLKVVISQPQLQKHSSASLSSSSSGKKLSQTSVIYTSLTGKANGKEVKKAKIQLSRVSQLERKKSSKGSRTIVLSQINPDV